MVEWATLMYLSIAHGAIERSDLKAGQVMLQSEHTLPYKLHEMPRSLAATISSSHHTHDSLGTCVYAQRYHPVKSYLLSETA